MGSSIDLKYRHSVYFYGSSPWLVIWDRRGRFRDFLAGCLPSLVSIDGSDDPGVLYLIASMGEVPDTLLTDVDKSLEGTISLLLRLIFSSTVSVRSF